MSSEHELICKLLKEFLFITFIYLIVFKYMWSRASTPLFIIVKRWNTVGVAYFVITNPAAEEL